MASKSAKREPGARNKAKAAVIVATPPRSRRDGGWDERLRLTGDARFVEVEWSGRDHPNWPLPRK